MIIAGVIVYDEERMLPGCLESLAGQVDRIVVVDGAYAHFPHEVPHSTDRTREVVECFGAEWVPCPMGEDGEPRAWERQPEKRSAYLVGAEGDWYLRIDADERLVGELPEPRSGMVYALRVIWWRGYLRPWVPVLFEHRGQMRYEGAHCALFSDGRLISRLKGARQWEGAFLLHLKDERAAERQRAKRAYYAWQRSAERAFRERWNV